MFHFTLHVSRSNSRQYESLSVERRKESRSFIVHIVPKLRQLIVGILIFPTLKETSFISRVIIYIVLMGIFKNLRIECSSLGVKRDTPFNAL